MNFFGPKYKNDDEKFIVMQDFYQNVSNLLKQDIFISRKKYISFVDVTKETYDTLSTLKKMDTLETWCKKTKTDLKEIIRYLEFYESVHSLVKRHNVDFVSSHLLSDKEYFDSILKNDDPNIVLDEDQRKVVLNDEDYTLVIAGAGAGKTTVLEAKAKYLVEKLHVDPKRILIISFTRKATKELSDRFEKIGIPAKISTFHSIGNAIINNEGGKHSVKDQGFLFEVLRSYLISKLSDESFIKKILLFFASYLEIPFESSNSVELYKIMLSRNNLLTMKSELDEYKENLTKRKITICSERVRSVQECQIANFLFINGIDYEYEPIYPYCLPGTCKPYTPDFRITQGDKVFYLEHYGISEDGKNWRFTQEELEEYIRHVKDKERLHRIHKTNLICTYSQYNDKRSLISHLKDLLIQNGFTIECRDSKEIYGELVHRAEERYFNKLIQLISNFLNRFKTNNYKLEKFSDFQAVARENKDERTSLFLDIARQCYIHYEAALKEAKAIDFEDMINNAADILDQKIRNREKLPYDYVFIDEYQDISFQRFNLAEKLSQCSDAKIIAVGDDWQSIYRFSGSDVTLFTDFEKKMGYAEILYLRNTHRNSQELIDLAGDFVMKNNLQMKKMLKSQKHLEDPVVVVSYDDRYTPKKDAKQTEKENPFTRMGKAILSAIEDIREKFGENSSILLIGRYNFEGRNLNRLPELFLFTSDNRVIVKKYPKMKVKFMTAHSSKGLGYDNVILVNGKDDILGFPSKIEDDPVMKLVLKDAKEIDYAEERRLFYVALTRTKNKVYLITPQHKASMFITELMKTHKNIALKGPSIEERNSLDFHYVCPKCSYPLVKKQSKLKKSDDGLTLYVCSNDPEVCGFVTNDLLGGPLSIQKCPDCEDGYLIVKQIKKGEVTGKTMLGCTNYKPDGTGCNYSIYSENYSDSWDIMCQNRKNYAIRGNKLPIEKCVLLGYPIQDLLRIFRYVTGKMSQERRFHFNPKSLGRYLIGKEEKTFLLFHLQEDKAYGCIDSKYENQIDYVVKALVDFHFLNVDEKNYYHVSYSQMPITEDFARMVFEQFVK